MNPRNAKRAKRKRICINPVSRLFGSTSFTQVQEMEPTGKYARRFDATSTEAAADLDTGMYDNNDTESWGSFQSAELPEDLFSELDNEDDSYEGVSACPAELPTPLAPRTALRSKTAPSVAFAAGHLDAHNWINLEKELEDIMDLDNQDEINLERELEEILNADVTLTPPVPDDIHGGLMLMIDGIHWCCICGAAAKEGSTSLYLRKTCEGRPPNASMRQRRSRLIRRKHPTTCAPLHGTHKRARYL